MPYSTLALVHKANKWEEAYYCNVLQILKIVFEVTQHKWFFSIYVIALSIKPNLH